MITGSTLAKTSPAGRASKNEKGLLSDFHKNMLALNNKIQKEKEEKLRRKSLRKSDTRLNKKYTNPLQEIKEEGESNIGKGSKRNSSKYNKESELSDESKKKGKFIRECQSDIVNEDDFGDWEGGSAWEGLSDDRERKTHSDIHEMFYINEIFKDDFKFDKLMRKIERGYSTSSASSMSARSDNSGSSKSGEDSSSSASVDASNKDEIS